MPQIIRITAGRWSQARRSVSSIYRRLESQRETSISGRQIMELRLCLLWWRAVLLDILLLGRWLDCCCSGGCHLSLFVGAHGFFEGVHLFLDCIYRWLSSMFGCVSSIVQCCSSLLWCCRRLLRGIGRLLVTNLASKFSFIVHNHLNLIYT